jgi:hypothetical protein
MMMARKQTAPPDALPSLVEVEDLEPEPVVFAAVWPESTIRFLLDDGTCVDVRTTRDDSYLRQVLVARFGRIAGATRLPDRAPETGDTDDGAD